MQVQVLRLLCWGLRGCQRRPQRGRSWRSPWSLSSGPRNPPYPTSLAGLLGLLQPLCLPGEVPAGAPPGRRSAPGAALAAAEQQGRAWAAGQTGLQWRGPPAPLTASWGPWGLQALQHRPGSEQQSQPPTACVPPATSLDPLHWQRAMGIMSSARPGKSRASAGVGPAPARALEGCAVRGGLLSPAGCSRRAAMRFCVSATASLASCMHQPEPAVAATPWHDPTRGQVSPGINGCTAASLSAAAKAHSGMRCDRMQAAAPVPLVRLLQT